MNRISINTHRNNYRKAKIVFWIVVLLLFSALLSTLFFSKDEPERASQFITVGACGCVKETGVYRLPVGADLATLIANAQGLTLNGDISALNLNHILNKDAVYHVPCKKESMPNIVMDTQYPEFDDYQDAGIQEIFNFLYIGFPAVYFLIQYSTTFNGVNVIYIPHSTIFLDNDYRMIDLYFTLGIQPTIDILQKSLNQKIDYYYIQNKPSFIKMIDELGGLNLFLDKVFAEAYGFTDGWNLLDGWYTYEYIRFIDQKRHFGASKPSNSLENLQLELKDIELAYDKRQFRQKKVIQAIHKKINKNSKKGSKTKIVSAIINEGTVDSNIDYKIAIGMFQKLMHGSQISFGTLPGFYEKRGNSVYYIPEGPGYEMLIKREVRSLFNLNKQNDDQVLY